MALTYPPVQQLTPIYSAAQPATLGSNPWVPFAQANTKYLSLEVLVKVMRTALQWIGAVPALL
ncbi:hypothetical protein AMTR_s00047p00063580 [Amborella trichopoda]|uniref:Uncharacterized protein n=1 Tax=Amborella trichopoda TaxID=13333 RepID=U5D8I0_AMBTC|nr:hypothetical protein AMTR_s00047p00063580 [Amborella trichopoda]